MHMQLTGLAKGQQTERVIELGISEQNTVDRCRGITGLRPQGRTFAQCDIEFGASIAEKPFAVTVPDCDGG
jgi:hypothetical protein